MSARVCLSQIFRVDRVVVVFFYRLKVLNFNKRPLPRLAHLSEIATADLLCNIFSILSLQVIKRSSFQRGSEWFLSY